MELIQHRVNTLEKLEEVPKHLGVELDVRDRNEGLILAHDPCTPGESFSNYLDRYDHQTMIINIKSSHVEPMVIDLLASKRPDIRYFFLDSVVPMMFQLIKRGCKHFAVRYSEHEPIESIMTFAGHAHWVWLDGFESFHISDKKYALLRKNFNLCLVSAELEGRDQAEIETMAQWCENHPVDAVCTKFPMHWQKQTMRVDLAG